MNITCPHCAKEIEIDLDAYNNEMLTLLEASQILGIHPATLTRWVKEGKITAQRLGNQKNSAMRFEPADIEALKP